MCKEMIYQEIKVPKYRWMIHAFYDTTASDIDAVMGALYDINCDYRNASKAYENLDNGEINTGFCYSNYRRRASVLVISKTSSAMEFINTWHHELNHLQAHIAEVFFLDPLGEDLAYLTGDIASEMFPRIKHLFCDCCRKEKDYEKED